MRSHLTKFVTRLRKSGVRISVAETLDAMAAVSAAGLERDVLREALAATLVKDEGDRAAFDAWAQQTMRSGMRAESRPFRRMMPLVSGFRRSALSGV